jgi:rfaE bifunctional protein nucleotidyltransferase chain/domain
MKILDVTLKEYEIISKNKYIEEEAHTKTDYKNKICLKPWGYEFLVYENKSVAMWHLVMKKEHSTSLHTHFKKDTFLVVISGCAKIGLIDDKSIVLNTMESVFIPRYKFHSISSFSDEMVLLELEIFNQGLTFSDKNDLLRLDDQYKRKPVGYESSISIDTENLDKYEYFYLEEGIYEKKGVTIEHTVVSTEADLDLLKDKTYCILLSGQLFSDLHYCKEGSILSLQAKSYKPIGICHLLTIDKLLWQEDTKIVYSFEQLKQIKDVLNAKKKNIVLTSGCFDILHVGHLETLKRAKTLGDTLIVCLSSDEQIKALKGPSRPINNYEDRINLFKTITYVDYIVLYNEENIIEEETLGKIMKIVDPFTWVKGSDYKAEDILKKHPYLRHISILPLIEQKSTTNIVKKILDS